MRAGGPFFAAETGTAWGIPLDWTPPISPKQLIYNGAVKGTELTGKNVRF
jgi:hypothetical protein